MKSCEHCRFLHTGYYGEGICELFGDDLPEWAENYTDGCRLKHNEVKKAIKLTDILLGLNYGYRTKEEQKLYEKTGKEYKKYLKHLEDKYSMVDARLLFNANKEKFREIAKGRTFDEFIDFLHKQPNFSIMVYMDFEDKKELYRLATKN